MKKNKPYPQYDDARDDCMSVHESAAVLAAQETVALPEDMDYAHIEGGVLQITSDIEEEIAAAERGETVQMSEFKSMFAQWL